MKQVFSLSVLLCLALIANAQTGWTWVSGDALTPGYGIYGQKGISNPGNIPGKRKSAASTVDQSGNIWVFGGSGYSRRDGGSLNDLWKFDIKSGMWTWIDGSSEGQGNLPPVLGGSRFPKTYPTYRSNAAIWADSQGDLWIFGGRTNGPQFYSITFQFTDLWKYSVSTGRWNFIKGDTIVNGTATPPTFGTKGIAAKSNQPGSKLPSLTWSGKDGTLWYFGGSVPFSNSNPGGPRNDLWKFSPTDTMWTFMNGDSSKPSLPVYGQKLSGSAITAPGDRTAPSGWTDANGNLWLFGGNGSGRSGSTEGTGFFNDLWRYNVATNVWTWMAGDTTLNSSGNYGALSTSELRPSARNNASSWVDRQGNFFIMGGQNSLGYLNDTWKYDPAANLWSLISGVPTPQTIAAKYGNRAQFDGNSFPGTDRFTVSASGSDTVTMFPQGMNLNLGLAEIWKYAPVSARWSWISSDTSKDLKLFLGEPQFSGVTDSLNYPSPRMLSASWKAANGDFYVFGGMQQSTYTSNNQLWKFSPSARRWVLLGGSKIVGPDFISPPFEGLDTSRPSPRSGSAVWTDAAGKVWLFGGSAKNDLWKYDPSNNSWELIEQESTDYAPPSFPPGQTIYTSRPPTRENSLTFVDSAGNFWLFGGISQRDNLNEMWKYDPVNRVWSFKSGNRQYRGYSGAFTSNYGTKGVPGGAISGREGASGWTDPKGNFWIFGGASKNPSTAPLDPAQVCNNDLWKYDPRTLQLTWMSGDNLISQRGVYNQKGQPSSTGRPAARKHATSWTDGKGNLYLFGGLRDSVSGNTFYYNDLWMYSIQNDQWTWLSGDSTVNRWGEYGTKNLASSANKPGARAGSVSWFDNSGKAWIFGGYGYAETGYRALNDLMSLQLISQEVPLPVKFASFIAQKTPNSVLLTWITSQEQNSSRFAVERSTNGIYFEEIGSVSAAGFSSLPSSYIFSDERPKTGTSFYRLKQIDNDNKFLFSDVKKVSFSLPKPSFSIVENPVRQVLRVTINLPVSQNVKMRITDVNGRVLIQRDHRISAEISTISFNVNSLRQGTFFLTMEAKDISETKAFIRK